MRESDVERMGVREAVSASVNKSMMDMKGCDRVGLFTSIPGRFRMERCLKTVEGCYCMRHSVGPITHQNVRCRRSPFDIPYQSLLHEP